MGARVKRAGASAITGLLRDDREGKDEQQRREDQRSFELTGVAPPHFQPPLNERRLLKPGTKVKGQYESALKELLEELGIGAYYEACRFDIKNGAPYDPDFITSLIIGGRRVVLETHHVNPHYKRQAAKFMENFGELYYFILIDRNFMVVEGFSDINPTFRLKPKNSGAERLYAHEHWHLPKIRLSAIGSNYDPDQESLRSWKKETRKLLVRLIAEKVDREVSTFGTDILKMELRLAS